MTPMSKSTETGYLESRKGWKKKKRIDLDLEIKTEKKLYWS